MSTFDIPNPEEFLEQFNQALNAAPSSRLRHIIRDVPKQSDSDSNSGCDSEANAKVDGDTAQPAPDDSKSARPNSKKRPRARVRPRYAVCANCEVEYDVTKNSRESCCFHPEEAVADEKYWENIDLWDEEIDTEDHREDHPEGFVHGCCGKYYGKEGCKVSWHKEEVRDRKRRRI